MATVRIENSPAILNTPASFLTADIASGVSSITVKNITGLAVNQVLLIGELGSEGSEIVLTHSSTSPSGSTVTLSAATTLPHSMNDKIYVALYNQVEFSTATTATGSKSVLTTTSLWADSPTTEYSDTAGSSGYYFARFYNSVASIYSSYSDAMAVTGWTANTVGYMIERAFADLAITLSTKITVKDCYEWINLGMKIIKGKLMRWPEHTTYNSVLGQTSRGTNVIAMPSDAYDLETDKSLLAVRIGNDQGLIPLSPGEFDAQMEDTNVTQVTTQATSGQTTLAINNSYDFDDSGTVSVYVSATKYSITYTGVTRSATAGILTGVPASGTGSISVTIPVDTYVWQNEEEGRPKWRTVRNSNLEFWPLPDSSHDKMNIRADYDTVATSVDSDGDTIDFQRYDMLQSFLTWRIKMKDRNNGNLDKEDGYYTDFKEQMNDAIRTLPSPKLKTAPNVNTMSRRSFASRRPNIQDIANSDQ